MPSSNTAAATPAIAISVILVGWGREVRTPHFLKLGVRTPTLAVYQVRKLAFKRSSAEMQSTNCSVIYSNVKLPKK